MPAPLADDSVMPARLCRGKLGGTDVVVAVQLNPDGDIRASQGVGRRPRVDALRLASADVDFAGFPAGRRQLRDIPAATALLFVDVDETAGGLGLRRHDQQISGVRRVELAPAGSVD